MNNKKGHNTKKQKIGLAFSGGGAKGCIYLGVIKAFEEYGIKFDCIAGTSVGSIFGAFYAAGFSYERICSIVKDLDFKDFKTTKIFPSRTNKLQELLVNNLGDINIEDLKTPFFAVTTDLKCLKETVIGSGNLAKVCAGSCAVPGLFVPVKYGDKLLADGSLKNSMPADVLKVKGCTKVISVDIGGELTGGINTTRVTKVLVSALQILINDTSYKGYLHSDLVIKPNVKEFSFKKKSDKFQQMVQEGYRATVEAMPEIFKILNIKNKNLNTKLQATNNQIEK